MLIKLINKFDANVTTQVWMPYVFKENNEFFMIFTARSGDHNTDDYLEEIRIANSKDGINWKVNPKPILSPSLPWEGLEVENWGIIKNGETYYMSYESRGKSRSQSDRAIGIAYSNNLLPPCLGRIEIADSLGQNIITVSTVFIPLIPW